MLDLIIDFSLRKRGLIVFCTLLLVAAILVFPAGWMALGMSALRIDGPRPITLEGASL